MTCLQAGEGARSDAQASTAFEAAVRAHLRPIEGRPDYEASLRCHLDTTRFDALMREVSAYHPVMDARLLSSGCGSAGDLHAALRAGAAEVHGIEVNPELVGLAERRFADMPDRARVHLQLYDGEALPFDDDRFDVVLSIHVIEHTRHPQAYLDELLRVTAPGGCIVLDLPNRYYAFEQHSWAPLIHYLPEGLRDALIRRLMAPAWRWLTSDDLRYRLSASLGLRLPSADRLVAMAQALARRRPTALADAYFHSYAGDRVCFAGRRTIHLLGPARRRTTFRLVLRRQARAPRHASIAP
jgi:SAM-dependent methyltransferase